MSTKPQLSGTVEAYIHEGGPRPTESMVQSSGGSKPGLGKVSLEPKTMAPAELLNVEILELNGRAYTARLLDQPRKLASLKPGDLVTLYYLRGEHPPFLVSEAYVQQRRSWIFSPCSACGFSELFDAPQELIDAHLKSSEDSNVTGFTWACPVPGCGGTIPLDRSVGVTQSSGSGFQKIYWWLMGELDEPWGKAILSGLALLIVGGGFSWWSYVNRDPVTGTFYVMPKVILGGGVLVICGLMYRYLARRF